MKAVKILGKYITVITIVMIITISGLSSCFGADRTEWFRNAKFGMFVHWGPYSQMGIEASWPLFQRLVPVKEYEALARTFNPVKFDAAGLVDMAAKAGMKYLILTSKHHDGFAMYDTKLSGYSIMNAPYGKDIVRQVVDACHAAGMRVGFYFTLCDWHHPSYRDTSKPFPAGCKAEEYPRKTWDDFLAFMNGQLRELCTNYGKIDVLWFDGGWERTAEQWHSEELDAMIRSLQPGILINNRHLLDDLADFGTPEQFVPFGRQKMLWESCMTINGTWAYNPRDHRYKSIGELVRNLVRTAGGGGNLLLNIGPMPDGRVQSEFANRLAGIGRWMDRHSEAIYGTRPGPAHLFREGLTTQKDNALYLHILEGADDAIRVTGLNTPVESAEMLGTGSPVKFEREDNSLILNIPFPDRLDYVPVVKLGFSSSPEFDAVMRPDRDGKIILAGWRADIWSGDISYILHQNQKLISYSYGDDALIDWGRDSGSVEWQCLVPRGGEYMVSMKYEGEAADLKLGSGEKETTLSAPATNNVTSYRGHDAGRIFLPTGRQIIKVHLGNAGEKSTFRLREITFVPAQ